MRFKLISTGNCSFSVVLADVRSAKQLNITELELEDRSFVLSFLYSILINPLLV